MFNMIPEESSEKPVGVAMGILLKNAALHCRIHHLWKMEQDDSLTEQQVRDLTLYLANFAAPIRNAANETECLACGALYSKATPPNQMIPRRENIALHEDGEGRCQKCAYPLRWHHRIFDRNGILLVRLDFFPLSYHPSALEKGAAN